MNKTGKLIFWLFTLIGVILIVAGAVLIGKEWQFVASAQVAQGIVVDVQSMAGDDSIFYRAVVEFEDSQANQRVRIRAVSSDPGRYEVGNKEEVLYLAGNAKEAVVRDFSAQYAGGSVLLGMGVFFALMGGAPLFWFFFKERKRQNLLKTGQPIQTVFNRVDVNRAIHINGECPYVVVTHKRDPIRANKIWEFKSPNLWYDPNPYIKPEKQITVYVDPNDYRRYAMDVSQLPTVR
jgi:hypothetical protein